MVPWYLMGDTWNIHHLNQYQRQWNRYQSWWNQYQIMFYLLRNYQNSNGLCRTKAIQDPLKLVVANVRTSFISNSSMMFKSDTT